VRILARLETGRTYLRQFPLFVCTYLFTDKAGYKAGSAPTCQCHLIYVCAYNCTGLQTVRHLRCSQSLWGSAAHMLLEYTITPKVVAR